MKSLFKKLLTSALVATSVVTFASCGEKTQQPTGGETPSQPTEEVVSYSPYTVDQFRQYALIDLTSVLASCGEKDQYTAEVWNNIQTKYNAGKAAIEAAATKNDVAKAFEDAKAAIASVIPYANGAYSFVSLTNAQKTEILGLLEAYAVRNGITGISLFENGGYGLYSERIQMGTEIYIPGYGFGNLAEGDITAPMANEANDAWKYYYHTFNSSDPGSANYLNDKGSEISTFYGYFAGSFFTTFMNSTKDGYDWVPELAKTKPQAVNPDEDGLATKWKFPVRTGETDGLKYTTLSTKADRVTFNGRGVELEDYETAFKFLLTQANHLARGSEMASSKGSGTIKGVAEYYKASEKGINEAAWENVGIKTYKDDKGVAWFEYEFTAPLDSFYSMYYITSSLYQPIPQDFIDAVGSTGEGAEAVTNYCGYNKDKSYTPVDNSLALGAYVLEAWNTDAEVVYKKNPNYVFADTKYKVKGIHMDILAAAQDDPNAGFKEFLAGNIDSAGIPQDYLNEYKNDPRARKTTGDSNFKLNVNACDYDTWVELFGTNGSVTKTAESDYWEVEPALANPHFVKALSLSINRNEFADKRGSIASVDYLSSDYMSDPENGISYANTQAHKNAVAGLLEGTENGYNLQYARDYFKLALEELVEAGIYEEGTKENPTVINLEIAWQYPTNEEAYHNEIAKYFTDAFNHDSVHDGKFKLEVEFWVGTQWSDVYYNKLMLGQYDLGFGSISGKSLNPLDFMSALSSDQVISGEFTLNWGTNTNDPDADILVYNGMRWSYDALWQAANGAAVVVDGANSAVFNGSTMTFDEATSKATITTNFNLYEGVTTEIQDFVVFAYADLENNSDYNEYSLLPGEGETSRVTKVSEENGVYVYEIVLTAEEVTWLKEKAAAGGYAGIDVYYGTNVVGVETNTLTSVFFEFPAAE